MKMKIKIINCKHIAIISNQLKVVYIFLIVYSSKKIFLNGMLRTNCKGIRTHNRLVRKRISECSFTN